MKLDKPKVAVWEPPFIQPHKVGAINKFGHRGAKENVSADVFGVPVDDLVDQYGSPLFVTSESQLRSNVRKIRRVFERRYNNVVHGWSYKTNYISAVCRILHQEGSRAEVVSAFEYEKARALGVPGNCIIFNGPNKGKAILERAVADGAYVQVDHMDELKLIDLVAAQQNRIVKLGIRINFDTGFTEAWSRFGFNLESGQANEAVKYISQSPHLILTGIHSHIGTFILEPRAYAEQVKIMCRLMRDLEGVRNVNIDSLDIGGGFPSRNALQRMYLPPEQAVPDINEYADAVCDALIEETRYLQLSGKPLPRLIIESGRSVVDDAQMLITSIVGTKRLPDGRRAAILDAGTNLLFTAYWYNHQVRMTREPGGVYEDTVLYGPLCMNIDVVRHTIQLPPLFAGDRLVISPVGAYNNTQWLQFIEYRPNVVLVHEDGNVSVIRRAEDLSVMMAQDEMPLHLTYLAMNENAGPGRSLADRAGWR
ncbi:MAG: alanine racemase [Candidatus Obscuribacterales bacterium]|nr:alanine racemase [Candidatus Obscuribacterales bacterium]